MRYLLLALLLLSGSAAAQDPAAPWFLGPEGGVYFVSSGQPRRLGLASGCVSLAVSSEVPWVIGSDGYVWTTRGDGGNWRRLDEPMQGRQIAAGGDGSLFVLGLDGGVYRRLGEGKWKRVGLGTGSALAAGWNGDLFLVGTDSRVWISRGGDGDWAPFNPVALGRRVAAAPDGSALLIGEDGGVYRVGESAISRLGLAVGKDVAVDGSGTPYLIGTDNSVWTYGGRTWSRLGWGTARAVAFSR